MVGYADSDWGEDRIDRKSIGGYVFQMHGSTISWSSKKQTCVALSSTEAEFIALSETCKETLWIRRLLKDFNQPVDDATIIYEDNQGCLKLSERESFSGRSKHIDIRTHFMKDYKGEIKCVYCPTENMIADMLTKPLPAGPLKKFRTVAD